MFCHLFEVGGGLHLPDGLHESVPHDDADVGAGVAVCFVGELPQVGLAQAVRRVAQMETEHLGPSRLLRQRDVDTLLKSDAGHRAGASQSHIHQLFTSQITNGALGCFFHTHSKRLRACERCLELNLRLKL